MKTHSKTILIVAALVIVVAFVILGGHKKAEQTRTALPSERLRILYENLTRTEKEAVEAYLESIERLRESAVKSGRLAEAGAETADEAASIASDAARKSAIACEMVAHDSAAHEEKMKLFRERGTSALQDPLVAPEPDDTAPARGDPNAPQAPSDDPNVAVLSPDE